ncbi:hypothetical protein BB427_11410 [Pseudoalteromonas sp. BMB]|uniref:ImmA/IrrE family metallo-endopeptidase n=1 Tax=Pseudoalteromonas sp. BMB TaxID=1874619 RepID=UPI00083D4A79|nr:ImmA/IrrE family metallo-endopeptidase [Pseudoalteromonas sp. BMB]ODB41092.1 hypothetical protein BB427_11410 [Pseudoalteromonas sp. BMB]
MALRRKGYKTTPRNKKQIRKAVESLFSSFEIDTSKAVDVVDFIDIYLPSKLTSFSYELKSDKAMGEYLGLYDPEEKKIYLRASIYDGACDENNPKSGFCRFTIAHEIGHLLLHFEGVKLGKGITGEHAAYEDTEWQADQFAAELLMPFNEVKKLKSAKEIVKKFNVSLPAANTRLEKIKREAA